MLLLDESAVLRSFTAVVELVELVLIVVVGIAGLFLVKWVFRLGSSAPGSNRRLLVLLLAVAAFLWFVAALSR